MSYEDNTQQYHPFQGVRRREPVRRAVHSRRHGDNLALGEPRGGAHRADEGDALRVLLSVVLRGVAGEAVYLREERLPGYLVRAGGVFK